MAMNDVLITLIDILTGFAQGRVAEQQECANSAFVELLGDNARMRIRVEVFEVEEPDAVGAGDGFFEVSVGVEDGIDVAA